MSVEIVWPQPMRIPAAVIENWFVNAVIAREIPPERLSAKGVQAQAKALEEIGWIVLKVNSSCDTMPQERKNSDTK